MGMKVFYQTFASIIVNLNWFCHSYANYRKARIFFKFWIDEI